jgi:hypothetical protein
VGQYVLHSSKVKRNYESILPVAHVVVPAVLIPDTGLNLSFLPQRIKLRLLEGIAQHYRHPIISLLLSVLKAVGRALSSIWFKR